MQLGRAQLPVVAVQVRRHARSRSVRLRVDETGVVSASVPRRFDIRRIDALVASRGEWLEQAVLRVRSRLQRTVVDVDRGDAAPFLGGRLATRIQRGGRRARATLARSASDDPVLVLELPSGADAFDQLLAWYRGEARRIVESRVAHWSRRLGIPHGRVSIRDQRTRWGSCSHRGDLSFSWRLVLAPPWVLDAIVVHELCHVDELNHSAAFWGLLDVRYPRHREASAWLAEHGPALRVTRPAPSQAYDRGTGDAVPGDSVPAVPRPDAQATLF